MSLELHTVNQTLHPNMLKRILQDFHSTLIEIITARQRSGEGNVFNHVYQSFSPWLEGPCAGSWPPRPYVQGPAPLCTGQWPHLSDMFKLVHYESQTLGKRTVGIRLKCLLV